MLVTPQINEKRCRRIFGAPRVKTRLTINGETMNHWRSVFLAGRGKGIAFSQILEIAMLIFIYLSVDHRKSDSELLDNIALEIRRACVLMWFTHDGIMNMIENAINLSIVLAEELPVEKRDRVLGVDTPYVP